MAEAAITFLLEKLKEVVREYNDLISGAENEFRQLESELGYLKAFVKETAKLKEKPQLLKDILCIIREVVYVVEDTIDTCLTKANVAKAKAARAKDVKMFKRYDVAKEVRSLREERVLPVIDDVKIRFAMLKLNDGSGRIDGLETEVERFAKLHLNDGSGGLDDSETDVKWDKPIRQSRIVGYNDEEEKITNYLLQEEERGLDVIPIIGIPGQGKTTLTRMIFENKFIDHHFPIRIWVYISQKFNSRDVFLQILKKLTPSKDTSKLVFDELVKTVASSLEKRKFLLVLDDVWKVDIWEEIKGILPLGNTKSKVIITSREEDVAKASITVRNDWYKLRFLTEAESWELLEYEVFGDDKDYPRELKGMGQHIANKCDGVPLTLVVIGGILRDQLSPTSMGEAKKEWEMVAANVSRTLEKVQRVKDVVALSYNRLPEHLSDCFLYMGVFPRDYEIPVNMLFGLWIAEGFIQTKDGRSLEQMAEHYLNDLIRRNLVTVVKINHMGKVKTCRVHDMIRAFCIFKSKDEASFQEIRELKATGELDPPVSEVSKFRRLCFQSGLPMFLKEDPEGPHVHSLLCFYEQPVRLEPQYIAVIPNGFPKLRILESKSITFECLVFPAKYTVLMHLRYLTLCVEKLKILPKTIGQLWNLQTLVVETRSHSITMEANMWKMIWLRHIQTKAVLTLKSSEWEGEAGQNLQTLGRLSPESCTEEFSSKAKGLKTLVISGKLDNVFDTKFLTKLLRLEKLKLVRSLNHDRDAGDMPHRLPQTNCFPPYLKRLTLVSTFLDWEGMSVLATIRTLEVLKLRNNAFTGVIWNVSGYTFPNLQFLLIVNSDSLVIWEASDDSFPKLKFLVVKVCNSLIDIPFSLGKRLQKLEIERLRESAVRSAKDIAQSREGETEAQGRFAVPFILTTGPV